MARITLAPPSSDEHLCRVLGLAVAMGAEFGSARNSDGVEAHLRRKLHPEMAKPADAEDRHEISGPGALPVKPGGSIKASRRLHWSKCAPKSRVSKS
jgi:hypothetical protein